MLAPQAAMAASPAAVEAAPVETLEAVPAPGQAIETPTEEAAAEAAPAPVERMKPTEGKGMPVPGGIGLQQQHSQLGEYASWIHNSVLLPIIAVISLFVLFLLLFVMAKFNRRANPVASKTSHNTLIEIVWTLLPVLILVGIAVPSIDLLAKQFKPAPEEALTIKVTGNQWFWSYAYPDNGDFEITSYMLNLPGYPEINAGVRTVGEGTDSDGPPQLEVDNRLVVPAGEPIRLQITASDVIHSFAVPSLWFKLDAVPGRINEKVLQIDEPGVYYGQCSELCGVKHAYMPIAIEALPRAEFEAWVTRQPGGTTKAAAAAAAEAEAAAAAANDNAAAAEAETAASDGEPAAAETESAE
ncbi:MAG: cytochrome c oxidase subunit II [Sphingomonadaceae bacterium]